jgi:hypothetical protein
LGIELDRLVELVAIEMMPPGVVSFGRGWGLRLDQPAQDVLKNLSFSRILKILPFNGCGKYDQRLAKIGVLSG